MPQRAALQPLPLTSPLHWHNSGCSHCNRFLSPPRCTGTSLAAASARASSPCPASAQRASLLLLLSSQCAQRGLEIFPEPRRHSRALPSPRLDILFEENFFKLLFV
ncbi:uncharacterized protein LOC133912578 [Phragmites australis]|uniref:uncharacterized protein LOC133912578 n=1 Tax=Phragmites australis TaxID=29695 RepID=UPI002D7783F8|nr:uncharacterized protein LOC133912578 [Phragmites australis]